MTHHPIPTFHLYGEPRLPGAAELVHVETLDERSRPGGWEIRPHLHADLHHVILIAAGGGTMEAEAARFDFTAPCLLFMPAGTLHGFRWFDESHGHVLTIGDAHLAALAGRDPDIDALFRQPRAIAVPQDEAGAVEARFVAMAAELAGAGTGHRAAVEALLLATLVEGIRRSAAAARADEQLTGGARRQADLVARLRQRIDTRFRLRETVGAHAAALGTSQTALRLACQRVAGTSPAALLDRRALLEAQRLLLHSGFSVAEVAEAVGFEDPAYFTRFFRVQIGCTPRVYRQTRGRISAA